MTQTERDARRERIKAAGWTFSPEPNPANPLPEMWFHRPEWTLHVTRDFVLLKRGYGVVSTALHIGLPCAVATQLLTKFGRANGIPRLADCLEFACPQKTVAVKEY